MMTLVKKHPGELTLRRFLAEEELDAATTAHLRECGECAARLGKLKEEQKAFEAEVSFDRFAAGVEKAARQRPEQENRPWVIILLAAVAGLTMVVGMKQVLDPPSSRIKGGAEVDFVISGPDGQRPAAEVEQLAKGDRVRIGVTGYRHVLALSIDDAGEVSTVYAEPLGTGGQIWLPGSIEFTGEGREHLVVVLSDEPISPGDLSSQLQSRFKSAGGDLTELGDLEVSGVQVHRTFLKP